MQVVITLPVSLATCKMHVCSGVFTEWGGSRGTGLPSEPKKGKGFE